jgi:hypothetical protein
MNVGHVGNASKGHAKGRDASDVLIALLIFPPISKAFLVVAKSHLAPVS